VLADMRPSTLEWLASARNDVEFANQGGRYEDIRRFLVSEEARTEGVVSRKWRGRTAPRPLLAAR
jgi:hypothetical protein